MKKGLKVLLTFDYELPLGGVKDYNRGLFDAADRLLDKATALGIPIVLFADICSAIRFKEWDYERFYLPFKNQLQKAIKNGHDVQLHIHPHWFTTTYQNGTFVPSLDFSLSNFSAGKNGYSIEAIIEQAFQEMVDICREIDQGYECIAFRAGGYDVEPESKRILTTLNRLGVKIDSSVIKEFYLDYTFSKVDYSNSPNPSRWFISQDGPLLRQATTGLVELPITSKPTSGIDILTRRWKKIMNGKDYRSRIYKNSGKGFLTTQGKQSVKATLKKITNPIVLSLDKEYMDCKDLLSIVDYNIEYYRAEKDDLILTAIGHPKSMGVYHVNLMEEFVLKLKDKFGDDVAFVTYQDINKSLH